MVVTEEKCNIQNANAFAVSDAHEVGGGDFRVKISFTKSNSQYFGDALELASEFEEYRTFGKGKEQRHEVDIRLTLTDDRLWEKTRRLAQIIGNWKRSKIVISGTLYSSFLELERGVAEVKRCYAGQKTSGLEGDVLLWQRRSR